MKHGVLIQSEQLHGADLVSFAQQLETLGYETLWLPELFGREPVATAGYLLGRTERLNLGTGIANIYVRDAHALAQTRQTLCELSEGRFVLGLGVSNAGLVGSRGHTWQAPIKKMGVCLKTLNSIRVESPKPAHLGPIYIAAHGPQLQDLASKEANGVITYLMPPEHTARSRERIGSQTKLLTAAMFLAETDASVAREKARKALAYYVTLDYYHREWRKLGFEDGDFVYGGSDRLIDMLVAWGDEDTLQARLQAYTQAGADSVIVLPIGGLDATSTPVLSMLASQ
ncbi:MAG: LLM class flavin-dependent oxidoreductase [Proteobacteria bacterium]|nr:LLM class flavin-dependent oxidoreductase [Pseudomonadota bacterium]